MSRGLNTFFQIFLMFLRRSNFPTYSYSAGGVLCGVGAVVVRRVGASAVLALWGCGGPWGGPAAGAGIVAGRLGSVLLSIVAGADGGPGPLAVAVSCPAWAGPPAGRAAVAVAGPLLCLPGLLAALPGVVAWPGSWRLAVLLLSGSCSYSGLFPNCIAGFRGVPLGVFAALTRRGLPILPQKPIKRLTSKNPRKNKKDKNIRYILTIRNICGNIES